MKTTKIIYTQKESHIYNNHLVRYHQYKIIKVLRINVDSIISHKNSCAIIIPKLTSQVQH